MSTEVEKANPSIYRAEAAAVVDLVAVTFAMATLGQSRFDVCGDPVAERLHELQELPRHR